MHSADIIMKPIGIIHAPFQTFSDNVPIQGRLHPGSEGTIELFPEYHEACRDIEGFSHILLMYHFHLSKEERTITRPYMDTVPRGVFATRSPHRPNHIGLTLVRLLGVEPGKLHVADMDMVDGTPLLDIKPYHPRFDSAKTDEEMETGWMGKAVDDSTKRGSTRTGSNEEWLQKSK